MTVEANSRLSRECRVWCRYLIGQEPNDYLLEKYRDAHLKDKRYDASGYFDLFLLRVAATSPMFARMADSYAWLFASRSTLRRKLILLLAILENSGSTHALLDAVDHTRTPVLYLSFLKEALLFAARIVLSLVVLLPVHLALGFAGKIRQGGR